jgi:RHS repeat-associated protein
MSDAPAGSSCRPARRQRRRRGLYRPSLMLADLERARHPASSLSRSSRRGRDRCERSESRRGLQAGRRARRRGSECRKSLQAPGFGCDRARGRGRQNIFEQINNSTGTVLYLHHDQAGSTRLLTGSTGKVEGSYSYSAYGTPEHTGTATTPLGYDGQYTSSDTGLVYLRNRVYDPATAQFLTVDPAVAVTRSPYNYGGDNPVNRRDPDGLSAEGIEGVPCYFPFCGPPPPAVEGVQHGVETVEHGIESGWNFITEKEGPNDEGEAELREKEAARAKECGEPNPGSLEKLKQREIDRILDEAGTDAHTDKAETVGGAGREYDYYRDKETGEIYLVPKEGGEAIPTGYGR